jgi:hypothetical protein
MKFLYTLFLQVLLYSFVQAQSNPTLTAAYENDRQVVKLRWQHSDPKITSYIIQRSSDNVTFTDINTRKNNGITSGELLKYNDEKIGPGKNYYRLKIYRGNAAYEATIPVMVVIGNPGGSWLIYPVPAGPVLNLQYNSTELIPGVIGVTITGVPSGIVYTRLRLASTTRFIQIPIANLGRGIYDIRVTIQDKVVWNQRFNK